MTLYVNHDSILKTVRINSFSRYNKQDSISKLDFGVSLSSLENNGTQSNTVPHW